jgi:hypothetical protein
MELSVQHGRLGSIASELDTLGIDPVEIALGGDPRIKCLRARSTLSKEANKLHDFHVFHRIPPVSEHTLHRVVPIRGVAVDTGLAALSVEPGRPTRPPMDAQLHISSHPFTKSVATYPS